MADYEVVEPTDSLTKGIKTLSGEEAKLNVFVGGQHIVGLDDFKEVEEATQL